MREPGKNMRLVPGSTFLDRYRLAQRLGRGGMGEVWAATEIELDREVAIKLLLPQLSEQPEYVRRFEREMKALAKLSHPNIAQLYTTGRAPDGRLYMVMQRVSGITARRALLLTKAGRFDLVMALLYTVQVAEALLVSHRVGIAHRDVKLENVMVAPSGDAWLLDFGICQNVRAPTVGGAEGGRSVMGTLRYMAPEVVLTGHGDHRVDLYALGVMLYWMLTGRYPYGDLDDEDATGLQAAHAYDPPEPFDEALGLPESLEAVVRQLLAKNPDARYADAVNLLADLRALIRESVPPEHPVAQRVLQDRHEQMRKRVFARRQAQRAAEEAAAAGVGAEVGAEATEEVPSRLPVGVVEPVSAAGAAAREAVEAEPVDVTAPVASFVAPVGPRWAGNDTRPLPPGFQPASAFALPFEQAREVRTTAELPAAFVAPDLGAPFPVAAPRRAAPGPRAPVGTVTTPLQVTERGTVRMLPAPPTRRLEAARAREAEKGVARGGRRLLLGVVLGALGALLVASLLSLLISRRAPEPSAEPSVPASATASASASAPAPVSASASASVSASTPTSASVRPPSRGAKAPVKKGHAWGYD